MKAIEGIASGAIMIGVITASLWLAVRIVRNAWKGNDHK